MVAPYMRPVMTMRERSVAVVSLVTTIALTLAAASLTSCTIGSVAPCTDAADDGAMAVATCR